MAKARVLHDGKYADFHCPGCGEIHCLTVKPASPQGWDFNGNLDTPTFQPSVLVRVGHYAPHFKGPECWCNYKERTGEAAPYACVVCHSFVRDGMIEFLSDCTHALAGKTLPLPDII